MSEQSEPGPTQPRKRRGLRFSLRTALLLTLLLAVALAGFRFGRERGFEEGTRAGFAEGLNAKVYPRTYRVADLLLGPPPQSGQPDYATLIDEIYAQVQPSSWEAAGGPATLAPYPQHVSLVIAQTDRGHDEIAAFLEAKRDRLSVR